MVEIRQKTENEKQQAKAWKIQEEIELEKKTKTCPVNEVDGER